MSARATGEWWWRVFDPPGPWHALRESVIRQVTPYFACAECGTTTSAHDVEVIHSDRLDRSHGDDDMCGGCLHAVGIT